MAHYAKVQGGIVVEVIVAEADVIAERQSDEWQWIQTSYNTVGGVHYDPETGLPSADQSKALRKNFATLNMIYDAEADAFHSHAPYRSWTLNPETFLWQAPVPYPDDGLDYDWNERTQSWDEVVS